MLVQDEGFVIKSVKYGDRSTINTVFSKKNGLITLIHSRSSSKKSKKVNFFQALSWLEFLYYNSNKKTIYRIKEVNFKDSNQAITQNVTTTSLCFFIAEVLQQIIKEEEENKMLYGFIQNQFQKLQLKETVKQNFHLQFLVDILPYLGIAPNLKSGKGYFDLLEGCSSNELPAHNNYIEGEKQSLFQSLLQKEDFPDKKERKLALKLLFTYVDLQLNSRLLKLKSVPVLEAVFLD